MSSTVPLNVLDQPLLALAKASGPRPLAGCSALFELLQTGDHLRDVLRREVTQLELSATGFGILTLIHRSAPGAITPHDLAARLELAPQTISDALSRLELSLLIVRERDLTDRRRIHVSLTDSGRTTIRQVLQRIETVIESLMRHLSPAEITALRDTCTRLCPNPSTSSLS